MRRKFGAERHREHAINHTMAKVESQTSVCEMSGKPGFLGVFLEINPYPILGNTNGLACDSVPLGQTSLPNTS
jgi:hypothetical protein